MDCLIDTGAHTSFISEAFFEKLKIPKSQIKSNKRWITANGQPIVVCGQAQLKLEIGGKTLK